MTPLLERLEAARRAGRKLLVPYVMAGIPDRGSFADVVAAAAEHAEAVEVGLPYSDPLMDGPVIAAAAQRAIDAGIGPLQALDVAAKTRCRWRVAMTYYNPVHRIGEEPFCERLRAAGFCGLIVPDVPLEESAAVRRAAANAGVAWIPLIAPTTPAARAQAIAADATGFVYAVSTLGVTGMRETLSRRAAEVVRACRAATDLPVLVGIGVSTPAQAVEAASAADGVVIGSAVVSRAMREGATAVGDFLLSVREALDGN